MIDSRKADKAYEFNINKFCHWSPQEKQNIHKYKEYEKYEWFIESVKLEEGASFGDEALLSGI